MRPRRIPIVTAALSISLAASAPALGAIGSWQFPPTDLSPYGEGAGPSVVINPAADATAIWSSSGATPSLMRERTWTTGTWGPDTALSVGPFNTGQPYLAGNASGALSAVWRIMDGGTKRVQAANRAGGGWGAPTTLTPGPDDYEFPTAVIDSSGVTTAAWVRDDGSDTYVQWARNAGGTWSGPTDLTGVAGGDSVRLAVDGSGVVTAIWRQGFSIQARRFSGGAWGSVNTLDPGGSQQPAIVADSSGVVTAVWTADPGSGINVIRSSRFTGSGWSTPTPISTTGQDSTSAKLAVDASGAVTAVWLANTGANFLIVAARFVNGSWTTGTKISQAGQNAADPAVASGPAGSALATWQRSDGTNLRIQAAEFSSGAWEDPITLSPAGVSVTSGGATVAMSPSGAAVAGWALSAPASNAQAIRYVLPPAPASGSGGTTPQPRPQPTKARRNLPGAFVLNRKTRVGTTTGTVPAGTTRITQSAKASKTKKSKARSATGRCRITTVRNKKTRKVTKRTFRCTITLQEATWTLTTLGYAGAEVVAEGSRRVVVR